ncbi:hypothetical protein NF27_IN00150 [Candidatus Jidaibacter acanthamoeba]|uniref:Uncharacterized protein n=1 Tax=Candidatus Jidaibacter acanthamoebae TaxID=86105 RepID=A0A0C1QFE0_9RICK|nr:hypothetical protein NF27_IN00150 [Candidatus Jidaibacter acanthamoeba]
MEIKTESTDKNCISANYIATNEFFDSLRKGTNKFKNCTP